MANKSKTGNTFYEVSSWFHRVKILQEDGTIKYSKRGGFATAAEAEKDYRQCEADFKKAYREYQMSHKVNTDIGFKDYLLYWFEEMYSQRIENTTRMVGAYTLYDLILPHIEQDIRLRFVNVEYLDSLLETAAKTTESAGNKCREFLNLALKDAVAQGYIKNNPVPGTRAYRRKKPNVTILSKEKLKTLLAAASQGKWYLEILLAVFCGLRKGEIGGLKYSDFDMEQNTLSVSRQLTSNPVIPKGQSRPEQYQIVEKPPKTENSYRTIRVPEVVIKELRIRKSQAENDMSRLGDMYLDQGYISCQENGVPHSVTAFNNALSKLCERNALPHVTVHGLRHMYATILVEQGVLLVKISALLGHSSVNTTFEYYCEVMDENERIIAFMNSTFIPEGGEG